MYLLGDFSKRSWFDINVHFKHEITREDLTKTKDDNYQIINFLDKTYYDPDKNEWVKIETK